MGDRIGLRFMDYHGDVSDIIVHSHWMGRDLLKDAQLFYRDIPDPAKGDNCDALTARFLMWLGSKLPSAVVFTIDLNVQTDDSDCDDNGVWTMNMKDGTIE